MFEIKKTFEVAVAHRLHLTYTSKCNNLHGHNLIITVYCASDELDENGMVVDFTYIKKSIADIIDHSCLSEMMCPECDYLVVSNAIQGLDNPTAERLAEWICMQIDKCYRVDVQESIGNVATYIDDSVKRE